MSEVNDDQKRVILVPAYAHVEPLCEQALRELEARGYTVRRVFGHAAIDQVRNRMATDALSDGFETLIWIDADMGFDADIIDQLCRQALPIIGAIAAKKGRRSINCETLPGTKEIRFGTGGGPLEVRYLGTGILLTRREVYEQMVRKLQLPLCRQSGGAPVRPFFMPMVVPDGESQWYLGEDYAFCERARQCGFRIFADTKLRVDHIGPYRYSWEDAGADVQRYETYRYSIWENT